MSLHSMRIFSVSAHPALAGEIADTLQVPLGKTTTTRLADSEIHVQVDEVVRDYEQGAEGGRGISPRIALS